MTSTAFISERVRRIAHALTWSPRSWADSNDLSENLIDLLADTRHWCDRNAHNFAELDRQAYQRYLADLNATRKESRP